MEPIPETAEADAELGPFAAMGDPDRDLLEQLLQRAEQVRAIAPDCIGMSVASSEYGVTFTLVASAEEIAVLDGIQYLAGGPCVEGVKAERPLSLTHEDLMDEDAWQLFAHATAAAAVASTLTLPILERGKVTGSVNLYGASRHAFTGQEDAIARIFDAWAPGAVANADLSFTTRETARQAPQKLWDEHTITVATALIAQAEAIDVDAALDRLTDAARRAGLTVARLAETVVQARRRQAQE
jgi:GAF domain-containing protein